ncbi:MAG: hypothetical protein JW749_00600 [Sedimentisphaerales bacterium]|nr:hypothetical protein [Sedimentisphaerales bacterium]
MVDVKRHSINLVAIGRQNPQIINTDWLKAYKIVPLDEPPFKELFAKKEPFSKFVSTPVFTNLALGPIEFIVDQERFQITDTAINEWRDTCIIQISEKYFSVLCHTPIRIVGINMVVKLTFSNPEEDSIFQELFFPKESPVFKAIANQNINASAALRYSYPNGDGRLILGIGELRRKEKIERMVNLNYEFDFTDWAKFKSELSQIPKVGEYWDGILSKLLRNS